VNIFNLQHIAVVAPGARHPRALHWIAHLGSLGLFAVAAVDSSIVPLPLPGSTDLLLLWLVSRGGIPWLLVPSAVAGSILGGYTTWHIGWKGGRAALRRYGRTHVVEPVCRWVELHPILAVFLLPMLPPPIPLTAFVLAYGALGVPRRRFLLTYGAARSLRYTLVAWLGMAYGRHVVRLWSGALQRWSTPVLWTFAALLVSSVGFAVWQARSRYRPSALKDQMADAALSQSD